MTLPVSSLPVALLARAAATPRRVALRGRHRGGWEEYTWAQYAGRAGRIGMGLRSMGVERGHRVVILMPNDPAWLFADLGIQGIGATTVAIPVTSTPDEAQRILGHAQPAAVITDAAHLRLVLQARPGLADLRAVVVADGTDVPLDLEDPLVVTVELLERLGDPYQDMFPDEAMATDPDAAGMAIYSGGCDGNPTEVPLTHRELTTAAAATVGGMGLSRKDEVLAHLPLAHIAERLFSVVFAVTAGYVVNVGEGRRTLGADLRAVQPTIMVGSARQWEHAATVITTGMEHARWVNRRVYGFWVTHGQRVGQKRWDGQLTAADRAWYRTGWVMLYRPLRDRVGLRRVRHALAIGGPLRPSVLEFFSSIGVPVRDESAVPGPSGGLMLSVGGAVPLADGVDGADGAGGDGLGNLVR